MVLQKLKEKNADFDGSLESVFFSSYVYPNYINFIILNFYINFSYHLFVLSFVLKYDMLAC